jgi:hypothetical protein
VVTCLLRDASADLPMADGAADVHGAQLPVNEDDAFMQAEDGDNGELPLPHGTPSAQLPTGFPGAGRTAGSQGEVNGTPGFAARRRRQRRASGSMQQGSQSQGIAPSGAHGTPLPRANVRGEFGTGNARRRTVRVARSGPAASGRTGAEGSADMQAGEDLPAVSCTQGP